MRVAIYARVSTDEQAEHGYSIDTQLEICMRYVTENLGVSDAGIVKIIDDYTGTTLNRPGMNKLINMITEREIDAIVCLSPDRLSRSLKDGLLLRDLLSTHGIALHYTTSGEVRMTPSGIMMDNIYRVMSEYEAELIRERTMRGRRKKLECGYVVGNAISYGYRLSEDKKSLVICEEEAQNIRMLFQKYAEGMNCYSIARYLNDLGGNYLYNGKEWTPKRVKHYLKKASLYNGVLHQNMYITLNNKQRVRDKSEWVSIEVPKIIDDNLYEKVMNIRKARIGYTATKKKHDYLLTSFIYCLCGHRLNSFVKTTNGRRRQGYRCSSVRLSAQRCKYSTDYNSNFIDTLVWKYIENLVLNPDAILEAVDAALQEKIDQYNKAAEQIIEIDKKIEKLVSSYIADNIPRQVFDNLLRELKAEREKYYHITKNIQYKQSKKVNLSRIASALESATHEKKRAILAELGLKVTTGLVDGKRLIIVETIIGKTKTAIPRHFPIAKRDEIFQMALEELNGVTGATRFSTCVTCNPIVISNLLDHPLRFELYQIVQ